MTPPYSASGPATGGFGTSATLLDLPRIVMRHLLLAIAVFGFLLAVSVAALLMLPKEYQSEASLFVRLGRENASLDPTATTGQVLSLDTSRESEINSIVEMLGSRATMERVHDRLRGSDETEDPLVRAKAIETLVKNLRVESPRNTTVVNLVYVDESPERAQEVADTIVEVYLQEHMRINRAPRSYEFFEEQVELLVRKLDVRGSELLAVKNETGVVTLEGRQAGLQARIDSVNQQRLLTEAELTSAQAELKSLRESIATLPGSLVQQLVGDPSAAQAAMRDRLYELETQERETLLRYSPDHPEALNARRVLEEARRIYGEELPPVEQSRLAAVVREQARVASLSTLVGEYDATLARLNEELKTINKQEMKIRELERELAVVEANYLVYTDKLENARMDQALWSEQISNVSVIQNASFEPEPVSPKMLLGLVLGICVAGVGAVTACSLVDRRGRVAGVELASGPSEREHEPMGRGEIRIPQPVAHGMVSESAGAGGSSPQRPR